MALTYHGRWPAIYSDDKHPGRKAIAVYKDILTDDDPGCLAPVNGGQVLLQPVQLGISNVAERTAVFALAATGLIRASESMSEVGLCVNLDIVDHSVIEGVPEVSQAIGFSAWHPEVVPVAGEVRLARHADGHGICDVVGLVGRSAIVA